jgi:queuine tRNA-ribosyltransferase
LDSFAFTVVAEDPGSKARTGRLVTPHGAAETPVFMPVGTLAAVKALTPDQVKETGSTIILCNTFHLHERPGEERIEALGGLHRFMGYDGPILTDSGGFQVLSLAALRRIDEEGVTFKSPVDGTERRLTPESAVTIQKKLGSDIVMALDECIPYPAERRYVEDSVERTLRWERRSLAHHPRRGRALFAIGQGGVFPDLRRRCLESLAELPFDGFALGGLWVGEPKETFLEMIEISCAAVPKEKPRYLMGVGSPLEIIDAVLRGVDMFDCVLPTRNARNGQALTYAGPVRLRNACHAADGGPLDASCPCLACRRFSRAYLRHLSLTGEILASTLLTLHNLTFMAGFMERLRNAIRTGAIAELRGELQTGYADTTED